MPVAVVAFANCGAARTDRSRSRDDGAALPACVPQRWSRVSTPFCLPARL